MIELIDHIPSLLQYVVPGFVFLTILFVHNGWSISDSAKSVWSVVISYVLYVILTIVNNWLPATCTMNTVELFGVQFLCAILVAIGCSALIQARWFQTFVRRHWKKSIHPNVWDDMIDYDLGNTLVFTMKEQGVTYAGTFEAIEEKGLESWVVLRDYVLVDPATNTYAESIIQQHHPARLMINLRDVLSVEICYHRNSSIAQMEHLSSDHKST